MRYAIRQLAFINCVYVLSSLVAGEYLCYAVVVYNGTSWRVIVDVVVVVNNRLMKLLGFDGSTEIHISPADPQTMGSGGTVVEMSQFGWIASIKAI